MKSSWQPATGLSASLSIALRLEIWVKKHNKTNFTSQGLLSLLREKHAETEDEGEKFGFPNITSLSLLCLAKAELFGINYTVLHFQCHHMVTALQTSLQTDLRSLTMHKPICHVLQPLLCQMLYKQ